MASTPTMEFERPIFELEKQIDELKRMAGDQQLSVDADLKPLERKLTDLRQEVYRNLSPLQRLQVLHVQALQGPDEVARALGSRALVEAGEQAAAALLAWGRRLVVRAGARLGSRTPPANCTLAELPAPAQPMYLCGARLSYFSAILPITDGLGLAFAVTRYDGRLVISPTSCRELMPDPERFAQCLRDSFQELLALAPVAATAPAVEPWYEV